MSVAFFVTLPQLPVTREEPDAVVGDRALERAAARFEIGVQLAQSLRVEDRARDRVRSDLPSLLQEGDREIERRPAAVLLDRKSVV